MNKKSLTVILGIIVIALIGVTVYFVTLKKTSQSVTPTPSDKVAGWSTYTNSQYGYTINYPETDVVTPLDKDNDRLYVFNVKISDDVLIRILSKANLATSPTSCAAKNTLTEQVKCEYAVLESNANQITQKKFGENNFVYADFEAVNHPNIKTRNIWAFVANDSYIYQFEISNPDITKEALFKQIISTFKFTK